MALVRVGGAPFATGLGRGVQVAPFGSAKRPGDRREVAMGSTERRVNAPALIAAVSATLVTLAPVVAVIVTLAGRVSS